MRPLTKHIIAPQVLLFTGGSKNEEGKWESVESLKDEWNCNYVFYWDQETCELRDVKVRNVKDAEPIRRLCLDRLAEIGYPTEDKEQLLKNAVTFKGLYD
jgi:hypothetical protein